MSTEQKIVKQLFLDLMQTGSKSMDPKAAVRLVDFMEDPALQAKAKVDDEVHVRYCRLYVTELLHRYLPEEVERQALLEAYGLLHMPESKEGDDGDIGTERAADDDGTERAAVATDTKRLSRALDKLMPRLITAAERNGGYLDLWVKRKGDPAQFQQREHRKSNVTADDVISDGAVSEKQAVAVASLHGEALTLEAAAVYKTNGAEHTDIFASKPVSEGKRRLTFNKNRMFFIAGLCIAILITLLVFLPDFLWTPKPEKQKENTQNIQVEEILFAEEEVQLFQGGSYELAAVALPINASDKALAYESTDPEMLFVSEEGIIAVGSGWEPGDHAQMEVVVRTTGKASAKIPVVILDESVDFGQYPVDMEVDVTVRKSESEQWRETVEAAPGDTIYGKLCIDSVSENLPEDVRVKLMMSSNLETIGEVTKVQEDEYHFQIRVTEEVVSRGKTVQPVWGQVQANGRVRQDSVCITISR